jgi:hypothetical protein
MSETDRAMWRRNAEECVDLARITTDADTRHLLLTRAQEWLRLAYSEADTEFERVLSAFNKEQMAFGARSRPSGAQQTRPSGQTRPSAARSRPMMQHIVTQQQSRQQQQGKSRRDGNGSSRS